MRDLSGDKEKICTVTKGSDDNNELLEAENKQHQKKPLDKKMQHVGQNRSGRSEEEKDPLDEDS